MRWALVVALAACAPAPEPKPREPFVVEAVRLCQDNCYGLPARWSASEIAGVPHVACLGCGEDLGVCPTPRKARRGTR